MILGIDVDSVIADLDKEWFSRYNNDYNDNLKHEDITDWATHTFVKSECGYKIYDYLKDPTLYDDIKPIENSLEIVNKLKELKYRIIYITTTPIETPGVKFNWLVRNKYLKDNDLGNYFEARDKSLIACYILFDDKYENALNAYNIGVLYTQPWNIKYTYEPRVDSWNSFYDFVTNQNLIKSVESLYNWKSP